MANQSESMCTAGDAEKSANQALSRHGNRLLLIEALILTVLMCSLLMVIDGLVYVLAQMLPQVNAVVPLELLGVIARLLILLFVLLPLSLGMLRMAFCIEQQQEVVLADLFNSFSSANAYGRSLGLSFGFWWRGGLLAAVIALTYMLADHLPLPMIAVVGFALLIVAEAILGLLLFSRLFYTLAFSMQEPMLSLSQCRRESRRLSKSFRLRGVGFFLHFLPQILLGLLTIGILLLAHTIPKMLVSYFRFCRKSSN